MKRIAFSLAAMLFLSVAAPAQQTSSKSSVNDEMKKELVKLSITGADADRVIVIEDEFYTAFTLAATMPNGTLAERQAKEKKEHTAHVTRREKLLAIPMSGRTMEDVISVSDRLHRSQKNAVQ